MIEKRSARKREALGRLVRIDAVVGMYERERERERVSVAGQSGARCLRFSKLSRARAAAAADAKRSPKRSPKRKPSKQPLLSSLSRDVECGLC